MMKYDINWVKLKYNSEEKIKWLFFWGHTPKQKGIVDKSCFSQWWEQAFEVEGVVFPTAEHWMMAEKAKLFSDNEMYEAILKAKTPGEAKALGRKVKGFKQEIWEANRYDIVKNGNLYKFQQHEDLKEFLKNTAQRVLVEASPYDKIWGIGLTKDSKKAENPNLWNGINLLGFALMEVREML